MTGFGLVVVLGTTGGVATQHTVGGLEEVVVGEGARGVVGKLKITVTINDIVTNTATAVNDGDGGAGGTVRGTIGGISSFTSAISSFVWRGEGTAHLPFYFCTLFWCSGLGSILADFYSLFFSVGFSGSGPGTFPLGGVSLDNGDAGDLF